MRLLPKSDDLLDDLAVHAKLLREAVGALAATGPAGGAPRPPFDALEKEGDEVITRVIGELRTTFLTPLDRDDLFNLATRLSALLSAIGTARFFRQNQEGRAGDGGADLAVKATSTLVEAVLALRDEKAHDRVREQCLAVRALERESEHGVRESVLALAGDGASLKDLWRGEQAVRASAAVVTHAARAADAILLAILDS